MGNTIANRMRMGNGLENLGNRLRNMVARNRRENLTVFAKPSPIQATAKLVIKDFVEVMTASEPGEAYDSNTFIVGDTPMVIRVNPNGNTEANKGYVSVSLCNQSDADITVKWQLNTDARDITFKHCKVNAKADRGLPKFLSHYLCSELYREKDFVMTADVTIPGEGAKKIVGNEAVSLPKKYSICKSLYEKMERSDFNIICNGVEVPCHKHVLSAASPVFAAMVENNMVEAIQSKANLWQISEEVGRAFVKFIYTGELERGMLNNAAVVFLELGEEYDIVELKDLAEAELMKQLDKKNMVELVYIGDLFNAKKIFEAALKLTKSNMTWLRSQVCLKEI